MTESDFNLKITVRNARLLRAVREAYGSAAEMCRQTGIKVQQLSALMTMRESPLMRNGHLTKVAEDIVSALGIPADDLWPVQIRNLKAKRATVEVEMDAPTFAAIADSDPERQTMMRLAISRWSRTLTDRQKTAIAMHHSGNTLEEIGAELGGVTRERARQILLKAEREMRKRARMDGVEEFRGVA